MTEREIGIVMTRVAVIVWACIACGFAFAGGCGGGGAQTSAETARVAACQAIEDRIERTDAGVTAKMDALKCVRAVCDELHERIEDE